MKWWVLAGRDPGLIPPAKPTIIPGTAPTISTLAGYGLGVLVLAGLVGVGVGLVKLVFSDKSRQGGGGEPFKWIGAGIGVATVSGSLIAIMNGLVG
jgi:hypothetical protein